MPDNLTGSIKNLLVFIAQLILCIIFGSMTWQAWGLYKEDKAAIIFAKEGRLVKVQVAHVNSEKQSWRDYLGNVKYIGFNYQGKSYTTRFVQDTLFVSEGITISLLYHPAYDAFRQPGKQIRIGSGMNGRSILLRWSAVGLFSTEHRWLVFCFILAVVFFIFFTGMLRRIPGFAFVQYIAGVVMSILFIILAIYFTYDAWKHYQYYTQVKTGGTQLQVPLLSKSQGTDFFDDRSSLIYEYSATVAYQGQQRDIAISSGDYFDLKIGDNLQVYYNSRLDEMMSVHYSLRVLTYIFPVLVWFILIWVFRDTLAKRRKQQSALN